MTFVEELLAVYNNLARSEPATARGHHTREMLLGLAATELARCARAQGLEAEAAAWEARKLLHLGPILCQSL